MKPIDEKGKLFGKINIIDFLVILFVISLTPIFFYGYKIFTTPPPAPAPPPQLIQEYQKKIQVYVLFKNLPESIAKTITVNDKELSNEKVIAEIRNIESKESNILFINGQTNGSDSIIDNTRKQVLVKMLLNVNISSNNKLLYKGELVSRNKMITFTTDKYSIKGMIVPPPLSKEWEYYETDVVFRGVPKKMVNLIEVEDKEKDSSNRIIGEITEIIGIEPEYYRIEHSISGSKHSEILKTVDKNRVKARMKILVETGIDNSIRFKGKKIKSEQSFYFKTDKYTIRGILLTLPPPSQSQVVLRVKVKNVAPEIYNFIKTGDMMKIVKTGEFTFYPKGRERYIKAANIKKIISIENAKKEFYSLQKDKLVQVDHTYLKDMIIEIEALCTKSESGTYLFNGSPLRLGSSFTFYNGVYQLTGVVTGMT